MASAERNTYLPTVSVPITTRRLEAAAIVHSQSVHEIIGPQLREGFRVIVEINPNSDSNAENEFIQISPFHKRDFEFRRLTPIPTIWQDEYGNFYSDRFNYKAINGTYPVLYKHEPFNSVDSPYFIYGYHESVAILRAIAVSQTFREAGIDTDYILEVVQPLQLPFQEELLPLHEFKKMLIENMWNAKAKKEQRDPKTNMLIPPRSELIDVGNFLNDNNMTFVMYKRAQQVPERFIDYSLALSQSEFDTILSHVFAYINSEEQYKAEKLGGYLPQRLSVYSGEDVYTYFTDYFPKRLARNVARMHAIGVAHHMLNGGNFSGIGSIYDTESPSGEILGLGDKETDNQDIKRDLNNVFNGITGYPGINEIIAHLVEKGYISSTIKSSRIKEIFMRTYSEIYGEVLLQQVRNKGWENNLLENIVAIYETFDLFSPSTENYLGIADYFKQHLSRYIDIPEVEFDLEELVEQFINDYRNDLRTEISEALVGVPVEQHPQVIESILHPDVPYPETAADKFFEHAHFNITFKYMDGFTEQSDKIASEFSDDHVTAVVGIAIAKAITIAYRFCYDEPYNSAEALQTEVEQMKLNLKAAYS